MTSDELQSIGERLFGKHWQTAMAKELGVTARTVRRWKSGDAPVRSEASRLLRRMMENETQ
jgi:DNA-binding transcriptional regulator YiaG